VTQVMASRTAEIQNILPVKTSSFAWLSILIE
jgi:hypothetical protein